MRKCLWIVLIILDSNRHNENPTKTVSEPSKGSWICLCSWLSFLYYL